MQYPVKDYDPATMDLFHALSVRQPSADLMVTGETIRDGVIYAAKSIHVVKWTTKYRGDVLLCSCAKPYLVSRACGVTLGLVELYDVKRAAELTEEEWKCTLLDSRERPEHMDGYALLFRNPRRVVEMPVSGNQSIYTIAMPKGDITEYPRVLKIDARDWAIIKAKRQ